MAVKTTPNGNNTYQPFIGFTYTDASNNMWHSITDLKIYRTSNGNRYDENLTPTMTDKVVDVPGGDGQHYFGTIFKNRTFTVNYAFDNLKKSDIAEMKRIFCGDGIHELVFDEDRDTDGTALKTWSAKVTGTATMKHLCFEENGEDVYKGEGSITFTCYFPFARGPKIQKVYYGKNDQIEEELSVGGQVPTTFKVWCTSLNSHKIKVGSLEVTASSSFIWDSKTGLVTDYPGNPISYTGTSYGFIEPGQVKITFQHNTGASVTIEYYELYY